MQVRNPLGREGMRALGLALVLVVSAFFDAAPARGQGGSAAEQAAFWHGLCQEAVKANRKLPHNRESANMCASFLYGVRFTFDSSIFVLQEYHPESPILRLMPCLPSDLTVPQSIDIFVRYMDRNPEATDGPAVQVLLFSLNEAFPCVARP